MVKVNAVVNDVKARLLDLAKDAESHFSEDGDDEVFRYDYSMLHRAVELLDEMTESNNRLLNLVEENGKLRLKYKARVGELEALNKQLAENWIYWQKRAEALRYLESLEDEEDPPFVALNWLNRSSKALQAAGFKEASKYMDCMYDL